MSVVGVERGRRMTNDRHNGTQELNTSRMSAGFADVSQLADEEKEKLDALIERLEEERRRMMGTTELLSSGQSPRDLKLRSRDEEKEKLRAELENIKHYNSNLEQELSGLKSSLNPAQPPRTSTPHDPYRMPQHHHPHFTHPKSPQSSLYQEKPIQNNILYQRDTGLHNGSHSPTYSGNILATSGSRVGNHSSFGSNSSLNSSVSKRVHANLKGHPQKYHSSPHQPHYERLKGGDSPMLQSNEPPVKFHETYSHSPTNHPYDTGKYFSTPNMNNPVPHQKNKSPYGSNKSLNDPMKLRESPIQATRSSYSTPRSTHSTPRSPLVAHTRPLTSSQHSPQVEPPLSTHRSTERPMKPQRSHRSSNASIADSLSSSKPLERANPSHYEQRSFDSHNSDLLPPREPSAQIYKNFPQRSQSVKNLIGQVSAGDVTPTYYDITGNLHTKRHSSGTMSSDAESFYSSHSHEMGTPNSEKMSPKSRKVRSRKNKSSGRESNENNSHQKLDPDISSEDNLRASGKKRLNGPHKSERRNLIEHHTQSTGSNKGSLVHPRHVVSTENLTCSRGTLDTLHGGTSDPSLYDSPGRFESSQTGTISPIPDTPRSFDPRREYTEEIDPYSNAHSSDYDITDRSSRNINNKYSPTSPEEVKVHMVTQSDVPLHSSTHSSVDTLIKAPYPSKHPKTHPKPTRSHSGSDHRGSRRNIEEKSSNRQERPSPKARKLKKKRKEPHNTTDNESLAYRTPAEGDMESRFSEKSFRTDESFLTPEEEMKMLVSKMQEIMPSLHDKEGEKGEMSDLKTRKPMLEVMLAADQTRLAIGRFAEFAIAVAAGDSP